MSKKTPVARPAKKSEKMAVGKKFLPRALVKEYNIVAADIEKQGTPYQRSQLARNEMLGKVLESAELIYKAEKLLLEIAEHSEAGKLHAAEVFFDMAQRAIGRLTAFNPSTLQRVACHEEFWPMLVMKDPPHAKQKYQANHLKKIGLGAHLGLSERSLWKKNSTAKHVAGILYQAIQGQRSVRSIPQDSPWQEAHSHIKTSASRSMKRAWFELDGVVEIDPVHGENFVRQMNDLPDFNKATFDAWHKTCMALLVLITNDAFQEKRHGLFGLGSARSKAKGADYKRAPGHLREGIRTALKKALRSLLPFPS